MLKMKSFYTLFLMDCHKGTIRYEQVPVLLTSEEKSLKHVSELIKDPVHIAMIGQGPRSNSSPPTFNGQFQANRGRGRSTNNWGRGGRSYRGGYHNQIRIFIRVVIKQISLSLSLSLFPNSCFRLNSVTINYAYITAFSQDNLIWWTIVFPY